jgi:ABC-type antimicrobial peptide transport system permease subunit
MRSVRALRREPMFAAVVALTLALGLGANATMFTLFGVLGLLVAALGLDSVIAHDVSQRRHEIGVRIALGARREDVARLVVGSGVRQTLAGMARGVALSWAISTRVADLLCETSPRDPLIYGGVAAVLLLVALVACMVPASRASRLDPVEVLREDETSPHQRPRRDASAAGQGAARTTIPRYPLRPTPITNSPGIEYPAPSR